MRQRDYLCMFRSKIESLLDLKDVGLREITQAMFDYLEEREPIFTDGEARVLWRYWVKEFNAQEKKAKEDAEHKKEAGKKGGQAKASRTKQKLAELTSATKFLAEPSKPSYTETETETETENIIIENNNIKETPPTLDDVLKFAKDPSVALSQEEAIKFYDHYTAQSWLRSNGQQIPNTATALVCALRIWKSNSGKFDVLPTSPPRPKKPTREEIAEQINSNKKLFNELFWLKEGRNRGDYDSDPKTFHKWYLKDVVLDAIESPEFSKTKTTYQKYKEQ